MSLEKVSATSQAIIEAHPRGPFVVYMFDRLPFLRGMT